MKQAVFSAITTKMKVYRNYEHATDAYRNDVVDMVLMMMRWDGTIGFIGGGVDEGETHLDALTREILEEVGYTGKLLHNLVHEDIAPDAEVFLFHTIVSEEVFKEVLNSQRNSLHGLAEGYVFPLQLTRNSISNILCHKFAPTVEEELLHILSILNLGE